MRVWGDSIEKVSLGEFREEGNISGLVREQCWGGRVTLFGVLGQD